MIDSRQEEDAKKKLKDFIHETYQLLDHLVHKELDFHGHPFFAADLVGQIREAWEEFQNDFKLERAYALIHGAPGARLQLSGLYGKQLDLKLSVVRSWVGRFKEVRAKKILLRLLDAIDTVLDSLIAATGIDEALKEIKEILRNSIEED